jgi:hypothetical protein
MCERERECVCVRVSVCAVPFLLEDKLWNMKPKEVEAEAGQVLGLKEKEN